MNAPSTPQASSGPSRKQLGDAAEASAIAWLEQRGLVLVERNYRTPGRGGGEIDAIMRDADGTLVFVEVRQRASDDHGGAAASIGATKRRRIIRAAQHYLLRWRNWPPCRFDVMACDGEINHGQGAWIWLPGAFDAS